MTTKIANSFADHMYVWMYGQRRESIM